MISVREALLGAVLIAAFGAAGMSVLTYVSLSSINEAHDKIDATRVALDTEKDSHSETRVLLFECRRQVHKLTE